MSTQLSPTEYIRSFIGMFVFMLLLAIAAILIIILTLLSFGKATDWIVRTFPAYLGRPVLFILGIKFTKVDLRPKELGPAVYIFNHSSTLDIPAFLSLALERFRIIVKWELQYIPFFFIIGRLTGQVFIKRSNREHAVATLKKTYDRLKNNNLSVIIAPEGSRKHEGRIGPFKKGAFRMAMDLGYPIVPIYFDGNDELSKGASLMSKKGEIIATIHPPIATESWSPDNLEEHIAEVRELYLDWAGVNTQ
jgi:1-acyl-sn-glycerol-3-phosphate acyltransferase